MFYSEAQATMSVGSPPLHSSHSRMDFSPPHPEGYTMTGPNSASSLHPGSHNGSMLGNGDPSLGSMAQPGGHTSPRGGGLVGRRGNGTLEDVTNAHLHASSLKSQFSRVDSQHTIDMDHSLLDSPHHGSRPSHLESQHSHTNSQASTSSSSPSFLQPHIASSTATRPVSPKSPDSISPPSRSPGSPGLNSSSGGSRTVPTSLVDEEFLKHYRVDEIQGSGMNPLVDEQFIRHYQVEEIMAAAGSAGINSSYSGAASGGGYYPGYDYYMQGGQDYPRGPPPGYVPPDFKFDFEELCPVCGDKVSGYHYGMPTCESCKGFFKRTVQNKKVYSCVDNRQCLIDKTQRKRCPYCRFQKCLSVGMKLEAVRSDRMRGGRNKFGPMYKRDRALKQQALRQRQQMLAQMQCQMQLSGMGMNGSAGMPPGMPPGLMDGMGPHHMEPPDIKPNLAMLPLPPPGHQPSTPSPHHPHLTPHSMGNNMSMMSPPPGMHRPPGMPPLPSSHNIDNLATSHSPSSNNSSQGNYSGPQSYTSMMSGMGHMPPAHHHPAHQAALPPHMTDLPPPAPSLGPLVPPAHIPSSPTTPGSSNHNSSTVPPLTPSTSSASLLATRQPMMGVPAIAEPSASSHSPPLGNNSSSSNHPTPQVIRELQKNDPNPVEVQRKLASTAEMMLQQQQGMTAEQRQKDGLAAPDGVECRAEGTDLSKAEVQLLCKLCDQALFLLVEWARSAHYFKDLKVEDQMKLLQNCWSELLILDFIFKQMDHNNADELLLITGHRVPMDMLDKIGLGDCKERLQELIKKFRDLKLDRNEYACLRHLVLLNPDVATLSNRHAVEQYQEKVNSVLLEYCNKYYPAVRDKFGQLLVRLPEIRLISLRAEDYLYFRHLSGDIPESTLLMEMLHSKRK